MTLIPLGDKILIRPLLQAENKTQSGIILSENQEPYNRGVVVAVPSTLETPVQTGQSVLYDKHAGTPVTQQGETLLLVPETNIVGIES